MKFAIYSPCGEGASIGWRLLQEGNEVVLCGLGEEYKRIYKGIMPQMTIEEAVKDGVDAVCFDMTGSGEIADSLRKKGVPVVAGSKFADMLELDRIFSFRMCESLGIKIPPYRAFKKDEIQEAIEYIQETGQRYVLKPNSNAGLALTYVSQDPEDMIQELQWIQDKGVLKSDFSLQEFVKGIEISTECWYSKGRYFGRPNGTLEQKKFMNGDIGPNTGCASSVVWGYPENPKIFQQTLSKMNPILKKMEYTGPIDFNAIISEEDGDCYFLEWTPRFGYSGIHGLIEILDQDLGKLLSECAQGTAKDLKMTEDTSLILTISVPPYPLEHKLSEELYAELEGHRILNEPDHDHFYPHDVMLNEDDEFQVAGTSGLICFIGGAGDDLGQVRERVYGMAEELQVSNKMYRTDADARVKKEFPLMEDLGYETSSVAYEEEKETAEA